MFIHFMNSNLLMKVLVLFSIIRADTHYTHTFLISQIFLDAYFKPIRGFNDFIHVINDKSMI